MKTITSILVVLALFALVVAQTEAQVFVKATVITSKVLANSAGDSTGSLNTNVDLWLTDGSFPDSIDVVLTGKDTCRGIFYFKAQGGYSNLSNGINTPSTIISRDSASALTANNSTVRSLVSRALYLGKRYFGGAYVAGSSGNGVSGSNDKVVAIINRYYHK